MNQSNNGNPQINGARESVNSKVSKYKYLGRSLGKELNKRRRFRST
jgi:hypothetical protein